MPKATITCYCGSCSITLADGEATCLFQCGCNSCRQKIQFGQANGGRECSPLPKLVYVPSLIDAVDGQHFIWFPGPSSFLGQGTTTLQRSLKTKHFLEPPHPSRDCLVLPIVLPPLGRSPWPPPDMYRSGWT